MTEFAVKGSHLFKQFHINSRPSMTTLLKETFTRNGANSSPFYALSDINFEIQQDERIGIIGNNGSGKTTLLKLIANLLRPNRGQVSVNGSVVYIGGYGIGMLEELSVRDNIFLYSAIYGIDRDIIKTNFNEIIYWADLNEFIQTPLKHLSSGMRTRLAFSITRYFNAKIFLLDEALSAGDQNFREKCERVFESHKDNRKTFLVVSHSLNFVRDFCSKTIWLHKGKLMAFGETETVLAQYADFNKN